MIDDLVIKNIERKVDPNKGIAINNLTFDYGERDVVKNFSAYIKKGSFTSILGPNGSGKSTLVKLIIGILKANKGEITIDGKRAQDYTSREKSFKLSYVPQWTSLDYDFTLEDIVTMGRHPYIKRFSNPTKADREIIHKAMEDAGIIDLRNKRITEVSGGERQRAGLARALCQDSEYIILDEPVNHLDIMYQVEILEVLSKRAKEKTVLAVMHDINLASYYSSDILILKEGSKVVEGKTKEVLNEDSLKVAYGIEFIKASLPNGELFYLPKK